MLNLRVAWLAREFDWIGWNCTTFGRGVLLLIGPKLKTLWQGFLLSHLSQFVTSGQWRGADFKEPRKTLDNLDELEHFDELEHIRELELIRIWINLFALNLQINEKDATKEKATADGRRKRSKAP